MAETETMGFRTDAETKAKIMEWMKKSGISNNQALGTILSLIQASEAKGALTGRETEIDNFESLVQQIMTAYTASLQLATNAESRIREEFKQKLESQGNTIIDLQDKIKKAQEKAAEEKEKMRVQTDRLTVLTNDQADEIKSLKKQIAEVDSLKKKAEELTKALADEKEKSKNELEKAKMTQTAAVLEERQKCQEALAKVREEYQAKVDKAQATTSEIQTKAANAVEAAQAQAMHYQKLYEGLLNK